MKKICTGCGQERDAEQDFNWRHKERGIRNTRCKFCQSQASKKHYENNKLMYAKRARARGPIVLKENRKRLVEYLAHHPCMDCGQTDVRVLDFDHVGGEKLGHISRMIGIGYSWSTIEAEIAKCEVRCANCHRIKTSEKGNSWRYFLASLVKQYASVPPHASKSIRYAKNKQWLYIYLTEHHCVDCKLADIRCLEFDHVYGNKSASITNLINRATSQQDLEIEIAKCEVRCANCHRIKTLERGNWWRHMLE